MRVGHGFDVHPLSPGRPMTLGGVSIDHAQGLVGHSDADVLVHAVCDACLGAAGAGDLGHHFPDDDSSFQDIDSRKLLRHVQGLLEQRALEVINLDVTVIAQAPKLKRYIPKMCENIAADLKVDAAQVNIKATTTERLGYLGREEGIAAHAVVLLDQTGPG